jgi:flagellar basal-body rod protein FlgC
MSDLGNAMQALTSGMRGQGRRLVHIAENISNADTPGYRRKTIDFRAAVENGRSVAGVEVGRVRLDRSELERIHDPDHPMAGPDGYYDGSNVELVVELADAREAQRSYEANLKMFEQVRTMSSAIMDVLRR